MEEALNNPENVSDYEKMMQLTADLQAATEEGEALFEEWAELSDE